MLRKRILGVGLALVMTLGTISFSYADTDNADKLTVGEENTVSLGENVSDETTTFIGEFKGLKPELKITNGGIKTLNLSWNDLGVSKYEIYMASSKKGTFKKIATVTGTKYKAKNLPKKKVKIQYGHTAQRAYPIGKPTYTYYLENKAIYFKVRGVKGSEKTAFSDVVKETPKLKIGVPKINYAVTDIGSGELLNIDWNDVDRATGYQLMYRISDNDKWNVNCDSKFGVSYPKQYTNQKYVKTKGYEIFKKDEYTYETKRVKDILTKQMTDRYAWNNTANADIIRLRDRDKTLWLNDISDTPFPKTSQVIWRLETYPDEFQFRVRAYRTVKGEKYFGDWSETYILKPQWKPEEFQKWVVEYVMHNYPVNKAGTPTTLYGFHKGETYGWDSKKGETICTWSDGETLDDVKPEGYGYGFIWGEINRISQFSDYELLKAMVADQLKYYFNDRWGGYAGGCYYLRKTNNGEYAQWWLN